MIDDNLMSQTPEESSSRLRIVLHQLHQISDISLLFVEEGRFHQWYSVVTGFNFIVFVTRPLKKLDDAQAAVSKCFFFFLNVFESVKIEQKLK